MPIGLSFFGQAPFSVELWAKQTEYVQYGATVDHEDYSDPSHRTGWTLRFGFDKFGLERWNLGLTSGSVVFSTSPLPLGEYHHVVATYDGGSLALYLDGVIVGGPVVTAGYSGPADVPWTIGKQNCPCTDQAFAGWLDELAIYSVALPASRVLAHYNAGTGKGSP